MEKFKQLQSIKELYAKGGNIIQFLKKVGRNKQNTIEDILISYDFQSGSYIKSYSNNKSFNDNYCSTIAKTINELIPDLNSIIEIGVGEATTLNTVLKYLKNKPENIFGLDISWSRLKFAKAFLADFKNQDVKLCTGNLFETPFLDNSIDIVYTSHSIEPNGGKEEEALKELYRITNKYLVLLEPSYELGNDEAKARMNEHGYITTLVNTAQKLNYKIIEHRLFDYCANPLNPTGLIIIEKTSKKSESNEFVCPISHQPLQLTHNSFLYSKESLLAYPILDGIPCLLKENSILATHLLTDYEQFKTTNEISYSIS